MVERVRSAFAGTGTGVELDLHDGRDDEGRGERDEEPYYYTSASE